MRSHSTASASLVLVLAVHCGGTTSGPAGGSSSSRSSGGSSGSSSASRSSTSETVCDGSSVDEQTDPANCGGCGVKCAGTCALGRCLVKLAADQTSPTAIAVDTTSVYWTDAPSVDLPTTGGGAIVKVGVTGGAPTTLVSGQADPQTLALAAGSLYWANFTGGDVAEASITGGTVTTLVPETPFTPLALVANATSLAWTTEGTTGNGAGTVMALPLAGGTPVTLAIDQRDIVALAIDPANVYWKNGPSILAVALGGGAIRTLCTLSEATSGASFGMAVDATNVYWTGRNGSAGTLLKVPVGGGTATTLASDPDTLSVLAIDATSVYFTGSGGIEKVAIDGGATTTLAAGHSAVGIAVDATSVYWTEQAGEDAGTLPVTSVPGEVYRLTPK